MPVSPTLAEDLATATVEQYAEAERILLAAMARYLARGADSPTWLEEKLLAVQLLQRQARGVLDGLERSTGAEIAKAIQAAYNRGGAAAVADLAGLGADRLEDLAEPLHVPGAGAVDRLIEETVDVVHSAHPRILRNTVDVYRQVVAETAGQVLLGTRTRREAAGEALQRFAARGVTGFVDNAGRSWSLESYTEMAVRSASARAAVQAHTDRLRAYGQDLVIVSDAPQECEICRPWEGKVLSLSGRMSGTVEGGRGVRVAGTLDEARRAGLFHPGCRHSTGIYLPGVTRPVRVTADPAGDAARQQLRYLERQTRAWKRRAAASTTEEQRVAAERRARAYQARIREHVASTSAKRQPQRERLGTL